MLQVDIENFYYKTDPSKTIIIQDFHLECSNGDILGLIGNNGCGKSTLLYCIAGLEQEARRKILLNGKIYDKPGRSIQIVFQDQRLFPWLTIRENMVFASNGKKSELDKILSEFGLHDIADDKPSLTSGGQQQRASIARVFVDLPKCILLDEPFNHLDIEWRMKICRSLKKAVCNNNSLAILVSHNLDALKSVCNKILIMEGPPLLCVNILELSNNSPNKNDMIVDAINKHYDKSS